MQKSWHILYINAVHSLADKLNDKFIQHLNMAPPAFRWSWWQGHPHKMSTLHDNLTNIHYCDAIMGRVASQITSLTIVYTTVYSDADQSKHQSSASLAFVWGIHRDRWIPRTKGQLRGKCFHLMRSSWRNQEISNVTYHEEMSLFQALCLFVWHRCHTVVRCMVNSISLFTSRQYWHHMFEGHFPSSK